MARRTQAELIAEIARIHGVLDVLFSGAVESIDTADRQVISDLPDRDLWVSRLRAKGVGDAEILAGYEQAVNDLLSVFLETGSEAVEEQRRIQLRYQTSTGRALFRDITDPRVRLRKILSRGRIRSETEYHLATALLSDVEQRVFDPDEVQDLGQMLIKSETPT